MAIAVVIGGTSITFSRTRQAESAETLLDLTIAALGVETTTECGCKDARRILHQPTAWTVER